MLNQIFGNRSSDYKLIPKFFNWATAIIGWFKPRHQAFALCINFKWNLKLKAAESLYLDKRLSIKVLLRSPGTCPEPTNGSTFLGGWHSTVVSVRASGPSCPGFESWRSRHFFRENKAFSENKLSMLPKRLIDGAAA